MVSSLIQPHGGQLAELLVDAERAESLRAESRDWPSWTLTPRQLCDLELLLNGGFSPLGGFMARTDYESVRDTLRTANGTLWPVPVTLDLTREFADGLEPGVRLALRDQEGVMLAVLEVDELWTPDLELEAERVLGTTNPEHPALSHLRHETHPVYVGGRVEGVQLPPHFDFLRLRLTPRELRHEFSRLGWRKIVAFQTRNVMHRAQHELTLRAARENEANLLIHPVVGRTKPGDLDHYTRVHCYQAILARYPQHTAMLSLLPLAMRLGGPREALWHAIIHKNFGCTHFIVGSDHAGPGHDSAGQPFYEPYAAQELVREHEEELGLRMVPSRNLVYVEDYDAYSPDDKVPTTARVLAISSDDLRRRLAEDRDIPEWFTFPAVAETLRRRHPPRHRQGVTIFLTGLSGAGKSTIANALLVKFLEMAGRPVTLLDGDVVRRNLSSELGFSKEHRDINIRRIGFVASEITKNGGIAICAPIAPYERVREEVRKMIEPHGGFILVHVATPLDVCEGRDRKGLYAKARAGIIKEFTGISDPYELPQSPAITLATTDMTPEESAQHILLHLEREGYVGASD